MLRVIVLVALALATSACALTTDNIDVPYQPAANETPGAVAGASSATVAVASVDARTTYRDRVSTKKNGYGIEMAAILATNDIPKTVGDAIRQELTARGFKLGSGQAQLTVEVVKFYNDFKSGFFSGDAVADVALNVKIQRGDGTIVMTKFYDGSGTEPNIQIAGGSNARLALIAAFRDAVHSVVSDPALIKALLDAQRPAVAGGRPTS
jgi:uncharacterized lipoprotein